MNFRTTALTLRLMKHQFFANLDLKIEIPLAEFMRKQMTLTVKNTLAASKKNNFTYLEKNSHRYKDEDLNVRDTLGNTPLFYAVSASHYETVETLLRLGADVNCKNEFGNTPLHQALIIGQSQQIINLLINFRADLKALNNFNQTPVFFTSKRLAKGLGLQKLTASIVSYSEISDNKFQLDDKLMAKVRELRQKYNQRVSKMPINIQNPESKRSNNYQQFSSNNLKGLIHLDFKTGKKSQQNQQFKKALETQYTSPTASMYISRKNSVIRQTMNKKIMYNGQHQNIFNTDTKQQSRFHQRKPSQQSQSSANLSQNMIKRKNQMDQKPFLFRRKSSILNEYDDSFVQQLPGFSDDTHYKESYRGLYKPQKSYSIDKIEAVNQSQQIDK
ncbi:iq calmodulin-binding motif family protein [Stylonychia lemnae]|uniref:Iq calmodulin-binding motif family protein n=1 Tax=Stylonychia lemnae TaxID=5949 RepID=A0A078AZ87_STYLE|nr:iq calmodulin-binding motif family protein [Stylonychia lemnae]|eukprot:CDW86128.1 iq calmodulin-binding motif family protein [Stylonychia lemnae]